MDDILVTSLVLVDTTGVSLEISWYGDTTGNWAPLIDLLHHGILTADLAKLVSLINFIVVLIPASLVWRAVLAFDLLRTFGTVVVTSGSVNGASLIGHLILVHPLKGVVSLTTMASIVTRAGD